MNCRGQAGDLGHHHREQGVAGDALERHAQEHASALRWWFDRTAGPRPQNWSGRGMGQRHPGKAGHVPGAHHQPAGIRAADGLTTWAIWSMWPRPAPARSAIGTRTPVPGSRPRRPGPSQMPHPGRLGASRCWSRPAGTRATRGDARRCTFLVVISGSSSARSNRAGTRRCSGSPCRSGRSSGRRARAPAASDRDRPSSRATGRAPSESGWRHRPAPAGRRPSRRAVRIRRSSRAMSSGAGSAAPAPT